MSTIVVGLIGFVIGTAFMHFVVMAPVRKLDREIEKARINLRRAQENLARSYEAECEQLRKTRN